MNIYVSNLGYDVQDADLKRLFEDHGAVSSAKVIMDKVTNQSRGFGFVEMDDNKAGENAIKSLNGITIGGRQIKVTEARPRETGGFSARRY